MTPRDERRHRSNQGRKAADVVWLGSNDFLLLLCSVAAATTPPVTLASPTAEEAQISSLLVGTQRRHRIHASGAARREKTSEERCSSEHQTCADERQWISRTHFIQNSGKDAPCSQ